MSRINILLAVFIIVLLITKTDSNCAIRRLKGQTVYSAVYSHIYYGDRENFILLSSTISIRNTDAANSIKIISVDYHDTKGELVEKMLSSPVTMKPLETLRFVIKESDTRGGSGAKCIIRWKSDFSVSEPLVESVMIGTRSQQGISFTSRGVILEEF